MDPFVRGAMRVAMVALLFGISLSPGMIRAAGSSAAQEPGSASHCEVAMVNPVTGNAECVKPPGAKVDPPPPWPAPSDELCERHADLNIPQCQQAKPPADPAR